MRVIEVWTGQRWEPLASHLPMPTGTYVVRVTDPDAPKPKTTTGIIKLELVPQTLKDS